MYRRLIAVFVSVPAVALSAIAAPAFAGDPVPELDLRVGSATRMLVVAPHPDDETLGAAGIMQRVIAAGGSVRVMLATSGDAFPEGLETATHIRRPRETDYRSYGSLRERETIAAMHLLSVNRAHLLFLGFPDGGLCLIASSYLSAKSRAFHSPFTGRVEPPASEQVIRGSTYRGADVRREIESVLEAYRPTLVVLPHPEDDHPDHCATAVFVREALDAVLARQAARTPRVLHYLIHYDRWPDLDESRRSPLQPPADFPPGEGEWRSLTLTPAEARMKLRSIGTYGSQMLVIGRFLQAFGRPNELFLEGRPVSPPECWCDATHVATEAPPQRYRRRPLRRR